MINKNFLKEKLEKSQPVIGTWSIIPSVETFDIIASTALDFIIIDSEHGPINFETAQKLIITCESRGVSPVMRLGSISEPEILKALDIGVHCVQIPNIKNADQVKEIIKLSKYPPLGERGFSPFTRSGGYSLDNAKTLTERANLNTMIAINIEGENAIKNIDEILAINELDIVFIGLFDLSKSLGIPGDVSNPKVMNLLEMLVNKINSAGKYAGTITTHEDEIDKYIKLGLKYIVHLVDCEMLRSSYKKIRETFDNCIKNG